MKRACIASVEIEMVIVVDDSDPDWKKKAREVAERNFRDDTDNIRDDDFTISSMTHLPAGYEGDSLVYTDAREDITADEAAKLPGGYNHKATP